MAELTQEDLDIIAEWEEYLLLVYDVQPWRTLYITIASSDPYPADPSSNKRGTTINASPEIFKLTVRWDKISSLLRCKHLCDGVSKCDSGKCFWMQKSDTDVQEPIDRVKRTGSSAKEQDDYEADLEKRKDVALEFLRKFLKDSNSDMDLKEDAEVADGEASLGEYRGEKNG